MTIKLMTDHLFSASVPSPHGVGVVKLVGVKRTWSNSTTMAQHHRKARVYGALDAFVPELLNLEPFTDISIPLTPVTAEDKVQAAMWSAWKRATVKEATERMMAFFAEIEDTRLKLPADDIAPRFSQKAGCTCGCSPAFILSGQAWFYPVENRSVSLDLHFEILEGE